MASPSNTQRLQENTILTRGAPLIAILLGLPSSAPAQAPLASLEHHVVGAQLHVQPAQLFVPKNIPGSLSVDITSALGTESPELERVGHGAHIEAVLRGPAFPAYRLLGLPNEPLKLPPIPLVGDYQIDNIRLVDTQTGATLMDGNPSQVAITVFPEVLVTQVDSRPLTLEEISERGISIDADNFSAVEFEASFLILGKRVPVKFPVVTPKYRESTEIIPAAEYQDRRVRAERINAASTATLELPEEFRTAGLDVHIQGLNFQKTGASQDFDKDPPPIPALMVIPGNVGFLNQFFSVQVFTSNAGPIGSGLSVHSISAELILPPGGDLQSGTPDDPVVMARVGQEAVTQHILPLATPGIDGVLGTPDDVTRINPGETGQAEFLVEGRRPGLHTLDINLTGILSGFAAGETAIEARAAGSVLIRNPRFSLAFGHPINVRSGEPYTTSITIVNTSEAPAHLVSVNLPPSSLVGAHYLDPNATGSIELGTILPGEAKTGEFRLVAEASGFVAFSNLTAGDGLSGRFDFSLGVDERGLGLSPGVIGYPRWVRHLPPSLFAAADRVLGQALGVAGAATLPPGIRAIEPEAVRARIIELTEAAQRLAYNDGTDRVMLDLLLDWHGGRTTSLGFDQILRETDAGAAFRQEVAAALSPAVAADLLVSGLSPSLAGRGESWALVATNSALIVPQITVNGLSSAPTNLDLVESTLLTLGAGHVAALRSPSSRTGDIQYQVTIDAGGAPGQASWTNLSADGTGERYEFGILSDPSQPVCYYIFPYEDPSKVTRDVGCDRSTETELATQATAIVELPPEILHVLQDPEPHFFRPYPWCGGPQHDRAGNLVDYGNYGNLVAVLFSKPMLQTSVELGAFALNNAPSRAAKLQNGGRVALVALATPIAQFGPVRTLGIQGPTDVRGNPIATGQHPIVQAASQGVAIKGRVIGTDGGPAKQIPVTLTIRDLRGTPLGCVPAHRRISQVFTDNTGAFSFDFVPAAIEYQVAATDTRGIPADALALLLEATPTGTLDPEEIQRIARAPGGTEKLLEAFDTESAAGAIALAQGVDRAVFRDMVPATQAGRLGSIVPVALRFRGRGTVSGVVLSSDGVSTVPGAAVNLFPAANSRERARGLFTDTDGRFTFHGVPLGAYSVKVDTSDGFGRTVAGRLTTQEQTQDLTIVLSQAVLDTGSVIGTAFLSDGLTPAPGARVSIESIALGQITSLGLTTADAQGAFEFANIEVGNHLVNATTFDSRLGVRNLAVTVSKATTKRIRVVFPGTTTVNGRVVLENGAAVSGARVAGGTTLATTASDGTFSLTGVPVGPRVISAGRTADPAQGIHFTRLGAAQLDVLPNAANFVEIRMAPQGAIEGHVTDATGYPVPNVKVAIPRAQGFLWTQADANGYYSFNNIPLGDYIVAAPSPPVIDVAAINGALSSGDTDLFLAEFGAAAELYSSGFATNYVPSSYGYGRRELTIDGQVESLDIQYLPEGQVSGTTTNHQDTAIGAEVVLYGITPSAEGRPELGRISSALSHPGTGAFMFPALRKGPWRVVAESPFYPTAVSASGVTTDAALTLSDLILQFQASNNIGQIDGTVSAGGQPVAGASVTIPGATAQLEVTDQHGSFGPFSLPAGTYSVVATDPVSGRVATQDVAVTSGATNTVVVPLLASDGSLEVTVRTPAGNLAQGATVTIQRAGRVTLRISRQGTTSAAGIVSFLNLREGSYSIQVCHAPAQTTICTRTSAQVHASTQSKTTATLGESGTISGHYLTGASGAPVADAQISVGSIGFATTDSNGAYSLSGVPLGRHRIRGLNPTSGRSATAQALLTYDGQTATANLTEDLLGEIHGHVIASDGLSFEPAATVSITPSNPLFSQITVTTGPNGEYTVPGIPPGDFIAMAQSTGTFVSTGFAFDTMGATGGRHETDIRLEPRASIEVAIVEPDGSSPSPGATLHYGGSSPVQADANGIVQLSNLPMGTHPLTALSQVVGRTRSWGERTIDLTNAGQADRSTLRLQGIGSISVHVEDASGNSVAGAVVTIEATGGPFQPLSLTDTTDTLGNAQFSNVPTADVHVRVTHGSVGASANQTLAVDGQVLTFDLTLSPARDVTGAVARADGNVVAPMPVSIRYDTATGQAVSQSAMTDPTTGSFTFASIPLGTYQITGSAPSVSGVLQTQGSIPTGTGPYDLGVLYLDELAPWVVATTPISGAQGVSVDSTVRVQFSEDMDPLLANAQGVYLQGPYGPVSASLAWVSNTQSSDELILTPTTPLLGETTYTLILASGQVLDATATPVGWGPVDLAGRGLMAAFTAQFTTQDSTPPHLVSFEPHEGLTQVDPTAVIRATFSEPIQTAAEVALTRLNPPANVAPVINGTQTLSPDGRILVFTPNHPLAPNASFTAALPHLTDYAGNAIVDSNGVPIAGPISATFSTIDTIGPALTGLAALDSPLVTGAPARFIATISNESNYRIRASADLATYFLSEVDDPVVTLPPLPIGQHTISANAIDAHGNVGQPRTLLVSVEQNAAPTATLSQLLPSSGPLLTGQTYAFELTSQDDQRVTATSIDVTGAFTAQTSAATSNVTLSQVVPATISQATTITVAGSAVDSSGQASAAAPLTLVIADGIDPALVVTPPPNLGIDPGQPAIFTVDASDAFKVSAVTLTAQGGLSAVLGGNLPAPVASHTGSLSLPVPPDLAAGTQIDVVISATDLGGRTTTSQVYTLTVNDVVPPSVVAVSPIANATQVGANTVVSATFSETVVNVSSSTFRLTDGANLTVAATVGFNTSNQTATLTPSVPLTPGATYTLFLDAGITDAAGHHLPQYSSLFTVAPLNTEAGPQIISLQPADGDTQVGLFPTFEVRFDAPLDPATVGIASATLTDPTNAVVPMTFTLTGNNDIVRFRPQTPLKFGTNYTISFDGGGAGTALDGALSIRDASGTNFTTLTTSFTTRRAYLSVQGVDRVVEGHLNPVTLVVEDVLSPPGHANYEVSARIWLRGGVDITGLSMPSPTAPTVQMLPFPDGVGASYSISAELYVSGLGAVRSTETLSLTSVAKTAHDDADAIINDVEMNAGLNPFVDDRNLDPDGDNVYNPEELQQGTSPFNPDTDGDGINDDQDTAPLNGAPLPFAGAVVADRRLLSLTSPTEPFLLPASTRLSPPFTLEFWTDRASTGRVFSSGTAGALTIDQDAANNTVTVNIVGTTVANLSGVVPYPLSSAYWHIAVVHDGTTARLFANGLAIDGATHGGPTYAPGELSQFQKAGATTTSIGEVRIWNTARSAIQVQGQAARSLPPTTPGLFAYWPMHGDTTDATGNTVDANPTTISRAFGGGGPLLEDIPVTTTGAGHTWTPASHAFSSGGISYAISQMPTHGRVFALNSYTNATIQELQGPTPAAIPVVAVPRLQYVPNPGYYGQDTLQYVTTTDVNGITRTSAPATLTFDIPPPKLWTGGDASSPTDWHSATNWTPPGVPTASDDVVVPMLTPHVDLSSDASVATLTIEAGTTLQLNGQTLSVAGSIFNSGTVQGGTTIMTGAPAQLRGVFEHLTLDGADVTLAGDLLTSGDLVFQTSYSALELSSHTVTVEGDAIVQGVSTGFSMSDPANIVDIRGDLTCTQNGQMTLDSGIMRLGGNLSVTQTSTFRPSPGHVVRLDGTIPQTVSLAGTLSTQTLSAGVTSARNHFQNLTISNVQGTTFQTYIPILGTLQLEDDVNLAANLGVRAQNLVLGDNAHVTALTDIHVEGTTTTGPQSSLNASNSISLAGTPTLHQTMSIDAGDLTLRGPNANLPAATDVAQLTIASDGLLPTGATFQTLQIQADVTLQSPSVLMIPGDLRINGGGRLTISDPQTSVDVAGGLVVESSALDMSAGTVDVHGTATFTGSCSTIYSDLSGGLLRLHGDLTATGNRCIRGRASHTTQFMGPANRSLQIAATNATLGNYFHNVIIGSGIADLGTTPHFIVNGNFENSAPLNGSSTTLTVAGNATMTGGSSGVLQSMAVGGSYTHPASGSLSVSGTTDINQMVSLTGHISTPILLVGQATGLAWCSEPCASGVSFDSLEVKGPVSLGGPVDLHPAGGHVTVELGGALDLSGQRLAATDVSVAGHLQMNSGELDVDGDLRLENSGCYEIDWEVDATDGSIFLAGDMYVGCASSRPRYRPSGTHRLIFDGSNPQEVQVLSPDRPGPHSSPTNPGGSFLNHVDFAMGAKVTLLQSVRIAGDLVLGANSELIAPGASVIVDGVATAHPGALLAADVLDLGANPQGSDASTFAVLNSTIMLHGAADAVPAFATISNNIRVMTSVGLGMDRTFADVTIAYEPDYGDISLLDVGPHTLNVAGDLMVGGALNMASPLPSTSKVYVTGNTTFGGSYDSPCNPSGAGSAGISNLSQGLLHILADFSVANYCANSFRPSQNHVTELAGPSNVSFITTALNSGQSLSAFQNLLVSGSATLVRNCGVKGNATIPPGGNVTIPTSKSLWVGDTLNIDAAGTLDIQGAASALANTCNIPDVNSLTGAPPTCTSGQP